MLADKVFGGSGDFCRRSVNVEQVGGPSTSEDKDNSPSSGNAVSSPSKHMYSFVPVDRYGDNKEDAQPINDLGEKGKVGGRCRLWDEAATWPHVVQW